MSGCKGWLSHIFTSVTSMKFSDERARRQLTALGIVHACTPRIILCHNETRRDEALSVGNRQAFSMITTTYEAVYIQNTKLRSLPPHYQGGGQGNSPTSATNTWPSSQLGERKMRGWRASTHWTSAAYPSILSTFTQVEQPPWASWEGPTPSVPLNMRLPVTLEQGRATWHTW